MKKRIFVDMDGVLAEWRKAASFKDLFEPNYFRSLKPQDWVVNGIKELLKKSNTHNFEVYILSSVLTDTEAIKEKNAWLDEYLYIAQDHRIYVPNGDDKAKYVPNGILPTDLLLDDYSVNLHRWGDAGGIGVKLLNGHNWTNGTWRGDVIPQNVDTEMFVELILTYLG